MSREGEGVVLGVASHVAREVTEHEEGGKEDPARYWE